MKIMNMFKLIFLLAGIVFISGCIQQDQEKVIPETMTYAGTNYINCHLNLDFPVSYDGETTLTGIVVSGGQIVHRQHPLLNAVFINDIVLYNPITNEMFHVYNDFYPVLDKTITVKGYYGGEIEGFTIFYVTDVPSWQYICCDATQGDTGVVSSSNVCFWFEI